MKISMKMKAIRTTTNTIVTLKAMADEKADNADKKRDGGEDEWRKWRRRMEKVEKTNGESVEDEWRKWRRRMEKVEKTNGESGEDE